MRYGDRYFYFAEIDLLSLLLCKRDRGSAMMPVKTNDFIYIVSYQSDKLGCERQTVQDVQNSFMLTKYLELFRYVQ